MTNWLQHRFNSLHVYSRLRGLGLSFSAALALARVWGWLVHPLLYRRRV